MLIFNRERLKADYDFAVEMLGNLTSTNDIYEVLVGVKERSVEELKNGRLIRVEKNCIFERFDSSLCFNFKGKSR